MKFPKKLIQDTIDELAAAIFEGNEDGEFENLRLKDAHELLFLLESLAIQDGVALEIYSEADPNLIEYLPETIVKYLKFSLNKIIQECINESIQAKLAASLAKNAENNAKSAEG